MNIDDMEGLDEETRKEIEELQKVNRQDHGDKKFASAQLEISNRLMDAHHKSEARVFLKRIMPSDDIEYYSFAQFLEGIICHENEELDEALLIWGNIEKSNFPYIYCCAQFGIGVILDGLKLQDKALVAWSNIEHKDNAREYAKAQYAIGKTLSDMNKKERALEYFRKIEKRDNEEIYSQAQFQMGLIYFSRKDDDLAINAFDKVDKDFDREEFEYARFFKGTTYKKIKNIKKGVQSWSEISEDNIFYCSARYQSGIGYLSEEILDYEKAKSEFEKSALDFKYESYCYKRICELLLEEKFKNLGDSYLDLLEKTLQIVKILKLGFGEVNKDDKHPERKLAHYTSTMVTNFMLEIDKDNKLPSLFRLNTINNVNDPSEGHLLVKYLKGTKNSSFYAPNFDEKLHAFIGCFTFNHDSLNQFRLYGKEAKKEASGVSLVFKKDFFQTDGNLGGLSFLSIGNNFKASNKGISYMNSDKKEFINRNAVNGSKVGKQPVMRCVYIDPDSDYIHLAQRNRITFFREFGNEKISVEGVEEIKAETEWRKYRDDIDKKTEIFKKEFSNLKEAYQSIMEERAEKNSTGSHLLALTDSLADEIILPLKYLIKHSAFQEEQECRMIYVTSLDAPEVNMMDKKSLFVEYEAEIKENLNKVYIAPAATEYQLYLAWLLRNTDVKIEISNNPYRQTS